MKLKLPEQNEPTAQSTPNNSKKLRKVLSTLPNANMGEMTKLTFQILRDQNRQTMPNRARLDNLEMLREQAIPIFANLKKYFINRTLPLPDKSQKIVNLNQSFLQEMVYGYSIIAYEAANDIDTKVDDDTLSTAIYRAMRHLSEMFLRSSEVYLSCPRNLWYHLHQLYLFAEERNLLERSVEEDSYNIDQPTISNSYKQILLYSLARPFALRQSDCERVYKELFNWAQHASIHPRATEQHIDKVFCIPVEQDAAPHYLDKEDFEQANESRILNANKLVGHVKNIIAEQSKQKQKIAVGDTIPLETLNTLVHSWAENAKRRFSRAERHGHIDVAIGLKAAANAINAERRQKEKEKEEIDTRSGYFRTSTSSMQDPDFTLESIGSEEDESQGFMTSGSAGVDTNDSWDMVAKGRALTDAYAEEKKKQEQTIFTRKSDDNHWEIVNISAGGYRLRWNSDNTSKAQIGEIIALRENNPSKIADWHTGVIRWMQFTQESGLEIGVQVISPKVMTASAQRFNRLDEIPFDCLMLPGNKALNLSPSAILPSHAFKTSDKLVIHILESQLGITLGEIREHTGSFTQFSYKNTEEDQRIRKQAKKEEANRKKDDFDELWSSL